MINVVIVDDHDLVRVGFRMIIDTTSDITVIGEAETAEAGLKLIREKKPDVALVDIHMPGMTGIEMTERVVRSQLATRILIVTVLDDAYFSHRLLDAGALGYLTKACPYPEFLTAIRRVADGRRYLGKDLAQRMAFAILDGKASPMDTLSDRELEVAMLLVRGVSVNDIGAQISVSPKTVSTYKQRLMDKLGIHHILELARLMELYGLADDRRRLPRDESKTEQKAVSADEKKPVAKSTSKKSKARKVTTPRKKSAPRKTVKKRGQKGTG